MSTAPAVSRTGGNGLTNILLDMAAFIRTTSRSIRQKTRGEAGNWHWPRPKSDTGSSPPMGDARVSAYAKGCGTVPYRRSKTELSGRLQKRSRDSDLCPLTGLKAAALRLPIRAPC